MDLGNRDVAISLCMGKPKVIESLYVEKLYDFFEDFEVLASFANFEKFAKVLVNRFLEIEID